MRMKSKYRDLISLIEFGDESYVITPFTNDYDNILLSISLIDDLTEFNKFPDQGTTIGMAISQAVKLFTAFDFLNASGNLMVIFSDGEDTKVSGPRLGGLNVEEILSSATAGQDSGLFHPGLVQQGHRPRVHRSDLEAGRREDRRQVLRGVRRSDDHQRDSGDRQGRRSARFRSSSTARSAPRFSIFALIAAACWTMAAGAEADRAVFAEISVATDSGGRVVARVDQARSVGV